MSVLDGGVGGFDVVDVERVREYGGESRRRRMVG